MSGHHHTNDPSLTQNQGNVLGDRPCVRQSRIYREHCGGNVMKDLLGQGDLKWSTVKTEGCYAGGSVYDHNTEDHRAVQQQQPPSDNVYAAGMLQSDKQVGVDNTGDVLLSEQSSPSAQCQTPSSAMSPGRSFRPGAAQANKQTFNIFTGK